CSDSVTGVPIGRRSPKALAKREVDRLLWAAEQEWQGGEAQRRCASHCFDRDEPRPRARSARRALLLLPRSVLVDVLRDLAWQRTTTGATLPPGGSTVALLCPVIEHEALCIGMIVKGMKLRQAGFNLHHACIPYVLIAVRTDESFSLHAAHLLS